MQITQAQLDELVSVIDDTVEYYCDQQTLSGQLVWTCIEALAVAKLAELNGELVSS